MNKETLVLLKTYKKVPHVYCAQKIRIKKINSKARVLNKIEFRYFMDLFENDSFSIISPFFFFAMVL
jgi:hypothetical protein